MSPLLRHILGWSLLLLGVVGLFLPILQGVLFLAMGAALLSPDIPLFHRMLVSLERRYPALGKRLVGLRERMVRPIRPRHGAEGAGDDPARK
jgi:uncharacterized membrane protein YbaN (DUF454 family)